MYTFISKMLIILRLLYGRVVSKSEDKVFCEISHIKLGQQKKNLILTLLMN